MADSGAPSEYGKKHRLLVYRFIARRYRPAGYLLFVIGILAQLPQFISELRPRDWFITYQQLSLVGLIALMVGLILIVASILEERRAWVQCQPDYLLINTGAGRVAVSYARFITVKSVRVADIFKWKDYKGRQRDFIKPLAGEGAVELVVNDFPLPEGTIRKRLSQFLITTRDKGFIFIVPRPSDLSFEINTFVERARQAAAEASKERYHDPLERAQRQHRATR